MPQDRRVAIVVDDETLHIEVRLIDGPATAPLMVFLHEGLGSVAMWKDFPERLCAESSFRGLVYSRPGYGNSTPRAPDAKWVPDFMHRQAQRVLPALLAALDIVDPPWLFGHSDGGSIALIHAASFPTQVAGVVVMAPHLDVEQLGIDSIAVAREAYLHGTLRERLARHHADVDSAFWGWNDIWLAPAFRDWNIRELLSRITCPVLAIQGVDDEYGTMAHIDGIADVVPGTVLVKLDECGHSPHRDQTAAVIAATVHFVRAQRHEGSIEAARQSNDKTIDEETT
ncbi:MAG: alpha/beta hydrolase [Burkholderiaceae bacterium]